MNDPRLIDMEPGGEIGEPHTISEESPILGTQPSVSTNDDDFQAQKLGMGVTIESAKDTTRDEDDAVAKARRLQGYGPGSGVGA
ncbi:hypothetical protein N7475_007076 [Penicillium sp. IBT 31633x]|nr:hypothetical protein N7475_007076 [Penicillium sp. IBT 31633x]